MSPGNISPGGENGRGASSFRTVASTQSLVHASIPVNLHTTLYSPAKDSYEDVPQTYRGKACMDMEIGFKSPDLGSIAWGGCIRLIWPRAPEFSLHAVMYIPANLSHQRCCMPCFIFFLRTSHIFISSPLSSVPIGSRCMGKKRIPLELSQLSLLLLPKISIPHVRARSFPQIFRNSPCPCPRVTPNFMRGILG